MKQNCINDDSDSNDPETLRQILKECSWIIKYIQLQNEDFYRVLGFEFQFKPEGVVTLGNGTVTFEGTWEVKLNEAQKLVMAVEIGDEPGVSFEWPLRSIYNNKLEFENEAVGYELELQRVCDANNTDGDVVEIRSAMLGGDWVVASYIDEGEDKTMDYGGYSVEFSTDNQLTIKEGGESFAAGLWRVLRNSEQKLKVILNFGDNIPFDELTDDWEFVSIEENRIELKDVSGGDGSVSTLVFEKP